MLRTQALVVGGGPAGATAARFLALGGIDAVLVERNMSFVKPCGGGIPSTAFKELDIPAHTIKRTVDKIKVVSPLANALSIDLDGGSISIVERGDFDAALRQGAAQAGASTIEGEFRHFSNIGKTITAVLSVKGEEVNISADYVIAADGVNSRVRSRLDIKPLDSFLTVSEKIKGADTDSCEFWFGASHAPRFYSWVFPQKDCLSVGTGSFEPSRIRAFWDMFIKKRGLRSQGIVRGYKIPIWQGDLYNSGKILFSGDAAGQVMPLSYEGIYYAMKSGEFAARAVMEGKAGNYKKLWQKRFQRRFSIMKRLWEYFLKDDLHAEKLVQFHEKPSVQAASMSLWLKKDHDKRRLLSYINLFRKVLS